MPASVTNLEGHQVAPDSVCVCVCTGCGQRHQKADESGNEKESEEC